MASVTPLGIALLGCGGVAAHYRGNYAAIPGTVYRLAVDVHADTAEQTAREYGVERWSTDWREALSDDIHIVDISTPNHLHREQAVALLEAGKHVLLQKPMAPSIADCQAIVEAAQATGRQAGVYISDLEDPAIHDLCDLIQGGYLGRITGVRARYAHRGGLHAKPSPSNWRGSVDKTGGGSFIQLSIHHINLLHVVLGERIASVMAYATNLACPNIQGDDTTVVACVFEKTGILGTLESAWNADGGMIEVFGTEGRFRQFGGQGGSVEVQTNRPFTGIVIRTEGTALTTFPGYGSWAGQCDPANPFNQHVAFVAAVRDEKPFPVTAEIGLYDVAVCKAVYASSESGRRVTVAEMLG